MMSTSRIRSVCSSWRSSLSSLKPPVQFPFNILLKSNPFFIVSPPVGNNQSNVWVIKVLQSTSTPTSNAVFKLQNPLLKSSPSLKVSFDVFSCPIDQITRSYILEYKNNGECKFAKVVLIWNSKEGTEADFSAMALFPGGDLGLWKPGVEDWIHVVYEDFSDIIAFRGKFYATSKRGMLLVVDPATLEWNGITPMHFNCHYGSYLVESNACFYLVYKVLRDPELRPDLNVCRLELSKEDIKVRWKPVDRWELED